MTTISDRVPMVAPVNDMPGPKQGRWTYKDYMSLPDNGIRYEIVNGVLFMTPSPSGAHQDAVGEIFAYLRDYVKRNSLVQYPQTDQKQHPRPISTPRSLLYTGKPKRSSGLALGKVRVAPFDVELASNVVVQPDVLVVLNEHRDRIEENRIVGAPDLAVEVASPGTATYDRNNKYHAYARAGVPEYWIADPIAQTVEVLVFDGNSYQSAGVFRGKAVLPSQLLPGFATPVEQFFT